MDLGSFGDEVEDDPLCLGGIRCAKDGDAIGLEGLGGRCTRASSTTVLN